MQTFSNKFLSNKFLLLVAATLACSVIGKAVAARPNILFIYTDDQSYRTVGCYDGAFAWVKTPQIDKLARQGVRFTNAYIGSWCMPSRATMLTGLHQHGIQTMRMEGKYPRSLYDPKQCPFWPADFRRQGYVTAHIGKWHTGIDAGYGRDWDHQIVWNRPRHPDNAPNYYDNQLISKNGGSPQLVHGYSTDNYTKWAIDFIRGEGRQADRPWFLWLCYGAVHGPFTPATRHQQAYPQIDVPTPADIFPPRPGKPAYARQMEFWGRDPNGNPIERAVRKKVPVGMKDIPGRSLTDWVRQYHQGVLAIDEGVGKLLHTLKETGQDEHTLIVFTSDQGFAWGQHGMKSKVAPYDAAVAAPLIVRPPTADKRYRPGQVIKAPVSGVDLPPTFYAQAKLPTPWKMHGHDLTPLLNSNAATPRRTEPAMLVHTAKQYGVATANIPAPGDPKLTHGPGVPWYVMLAKDRFKYVRTLVPGETEELYDLEGDPNELKNLAQQPKYRQQLLELRAATIAELRRTNAAMVDQLPPVATLPKR